MIAAVYWEETFHELLLIEISSYGGNSGAPVFAFLEDVAGARLLGVLKGSFREAAVKIRAGACPAPRDESSHQVGPSKPPTSRNAVRKL